MYSVHVIFSFFIVVVYFFLSLHPVDLRYWSTYGTSPKINVGVVAPGAF
jgi:hypothetical protein